MRILFFGTAEFAVPCLEAVVEAGHEILAVVTQPDKPQGRGQQVAASPVKRAAERHGVPVLQPRRVRAESFVAKIRYIEPDAFALAAFGQIIPQALLDIPRCGPINVHGSLLPKYRGAAPIQRAIMAGEAVTGVTTMWMDASLDTGDILLAAGLPIDPEDTYGTLTPKLAELGAGLLVETLARLAAGDCPRIPQDSSQATLAPMITPQDSEVDWTEPAEQVRNRIRGLSPRPGAFVNFAGKRVKLWSAQEWNQATGPGTVAEQPGTVCLLSKQPPGPVVAAGGGTALLLTEVQPESGRRMSALDWANGVRLKAGAELK